MTLHIKIGGRRSFYSSLYPPKEVHCICTLLLFFLKHPLLSAAKGGRDIELESCLTRLKVVVLDNNLISGHHTFFCLDLPFLHSQIHTSAVYLLPWRKHNQRVLPASHCLQAHKERNPKEVHWKSIRKSENTTQDSREEKTTLVQK